MLSWSLSLSLSTVVTAAPIVCPAASFGNSNNRPETHVLLHAKSQLHMASGLRHMVSVVNYLGDLRQLSRVSESAESRSLAAERSGWSSYQASMSMKISELEASRSTATGQLEDLINEFIAKQSGSADACHAQFLEAKHQLNQLHEHVKDLSMEVNATDHEITALNNQVNSKLKENEALEEWRAQKLKELEERQSENVDRCNELQSEMNELQQIAASNVTMDLTNGTVFHDLSLSSLSTGAEVLLPIVDHLKTVSNQNSSVSLVQVDVADNGEFTQVGDRGINLQGLRSAFKSVDECVNPATVRVDLEDFSSAFDEDYFSLLEIARAFYAADDNSTKANATCSTNDFASFEVAGVTESVGPPMNLIQGDFISVACASVNPSHFGMIWLSCNQTLTADASQCVKADNVGNCTAQKKNLEKIFKKTYVDVATLIQACKEQTTNGYDAAKQAIEDEFTDRRDPIQKDASELAELASDKVRELEELRPRLEDAIDAWHKLREQVRRLEAQCQQVPETMTDLNKVRDAIKALSLCPGLENAHLGVPQWAGSFVALDDSVSGMSNEQYDGKMAALCIDAFKEKYPDQELRVASVGEITSAAVLDLPQTNTADTPLIGACPGCDGDEDATSTSGHLRVCWRPGKPLTNDEKSTSCSTGPFSIVCVVDGVKNDAASSGNQGLH